MSKLQQSSSVALAVLGLAASALAGPVGESVVSGDVSIATPDATTWEITASDGAIIEYDSLDVASGEQVEFIQPDAAARVLNRIVGPDGTRIQGTLIGNGIVYLVNPAGVVFGPDAVIDVSQLFAAAAQLSSEDFTAGTDRFTGAAGDVENLGEIRAQAAHLIGLHVSNLGAIHAPDGLITMTAGDDVLLTAAGSGIAVVVQGGAADGLAGIVQSGTLDAGSDGTVRLGAGDAYALAINHPGQTTAGGAVLEAQGGETHIEGGISAGAGGIALTGASDVIVGDGALQSGGALDVSASGALRSAAADDDATAELSATGPVTLDAASAGDDAGTGALEVDAAEVALDVSGDARLALAGPAAVSGSVGGDLAVDGEGDLDLGASDVGGDLDASAAGTLTDSGRVTVTGDASLSAASVTADELAVSGTVSLDVTGDADVINGGDLVLGASTVGGDLDATALDGTIGDGGDVMVAGLATFTTRRALTPMDTQGHEIVLDAAGSAYGRVAARTLALASDDVAEADVTIAHASDIVVEALDTAGAVSIDAGDANDATLSQAMGATDLLRALEVAARNVSLRDVATRRLQRYIARGGSIAASGVYETNAGGGIVFDGPLTIADAVVLSTGGSAAPPGSLDGRIELRGTVDGPGSLLALVRDGDPVVFSDDVGASSPLSELRLIAAGDTSTRIGGSRGPGIVFEGTLVHADTILLNVPLSGADGIRDPGTQILRPTLAGTGSGLTLRADTRLQMGRRERLTVLGDLLVDAPEAVLADLAALRIDVDSASILLLPRDSEFVELPELTPAGLPRTVNDLGVDFVANTIDFSSVPQIAGAGPAPIFVTPNNTGVGPNLDGFVWRSFRTGTTPVTLGDLQAALSVFDNTGTGPGIDADGRQLSLESIFDQFVWAPEPVYAFDALPPGLIGHGRVEQIRENRPLWSDEVLAFLQTPTHGGGGWSAGSRLGLIGGGGSGLTLAADLGLPQVAAGGGDVNVDSSFALANDSARSALDLYASLQQRDPQMRERLLVAWAEFRSDDRGVVRGETARVFASWLREAPEQADLVAHLKAYGQLIGLLEELYLTESEADRLRAELLEGLGAGELPVESVIRATI